MTPSNLQDLLRRIRDIRVGVLGDFCLDVYYMLDARGSEISLETGLPTRAVRSQRYLLGGAGNVAANLRSMGVGRVSAFGVAGRDPFGHEMQMLLMEQGTTVDGLLTQDTDWDTHVYTKPYDRNREENRIDFGNFNRLHPSTHARLLAVLEERLPDLDIILINQQVLSGIHTPEFRQDLGALVQRHPENRFIADSRHHSNEYPGTIRKINMREALRLTGGDEASAEWLSPAEREIVARTLYERWGTPLFLTRGEHGCVVMDETGYQELPGLLIVSPVDPVGAGDSMLAGIAAALGAGATPFIAAQLGSFVAGVTVQKLFQTGTATPEEILAIGSEPDYRYRPDIARQPRKATFHAGSSIEIVSTLPDWKGFTYAIFDQDGTLSTLRQGWEDIMEPMMIRAILGDPSREIPETLYQEVLHNVREYIDKTTGVQTLVQMQGLRDLVRRFGLVPEAEILDEFGYKKIYNDELLGMVRERVRQLNSGELDVEDFTVKKAIPFLRALHARGVRLYLASGTDQEDVVREAEILGYRGLFGEHIYGSIGDPQKDAKRIVLERLMHDISDRASTRIVTFGDGPVEMRETHKRGGYAIGIASNEIRRHGLNPAKRRRLIEAGADLIVPDYSQMESLLSILF
jgi:bifunctional ADP-heptose synthase (sugar kinase/adenylyltransferase)/phosphoglycolate phosphatase-like HAD superfamily hydrolase